MDPAVRFQISIIHIKRAEPLLWHSPPMEFGHAFAESHQLLAVPIPSVFFGNGKVAHVWLPPSHWLLHVRRAKDWGAGEAEPCCDL